MLEVSLRLVYARFRALIEVPWRMRSAKPMLLVPGSLALGVGSAPTNIAPVDYITDWLRRRMPEFGHHSSQLADRILIVQAKTGAGKSTVLPVAIFRLLRGELTPPTQRYHGPSVICTQPRVLTAIALARDVSSRAWNPDMILGVTTGFQTGSVVERPPSGLIFATAGVFAVQLQQMSDADIMSRYRFILVDEAHERALDCDIGLAQIRDFFLRNAGNPQLPFLLVMSATFDPGRYAEYFGLGPKNVVIVEGRAYRIDTIWPAAGVNNYPLAAADTAFRIHNDHLDDPPERADILIFMPGAAESKTVADALRKKAHDAEQPFLVLIINREVVTSQTGDYVLVFEKPELLPPIGGKRPLRRIVISTIVAETGLTIDTLRYVIDGGWVRSSETYQPWGVRGLITRPAPRSRVAQRMGRAGRLFEGEYHPLFTENVFNALDEQQLPDIFVNGFGGYYLAVVAWQQRQKLLTGVVPEFRVEDMSLLDPPPPEVFLSSNAAAVALGFISPRAPLPIKWPPVFSDAKIAGNFSVSQTATTRGYGLTPLGFVASLFVRTPMEGVRALLATYMWDVAATDMITAVAMFGTSLSDLYNKKAERTTQLSGLPLGADALRAAVPPFLLRRADTTGGSATGGASSIPLPPGESEEFYFRTKLLIADDFIEAVLIFDAFATRLDAAKGNLAAVSAWCASVELNFKKLLDIATQRDACFAEMITAGLNPYHLPERRLAALSASEFTEGVRRFKRCMYDGLREKLLRYDASESAYVTHQGLRVRAPPLFTDQMAARLRALRVTQDAPTSWRPQWLLTDQVVLKLIPGRPEDAGDPLLYGVHANLVSVMDGFVDIDPEFGDPREFGDSAGNSTS